PLASITCPTGAVNVSPGSGSNIQNAVNAYPAGTAFCLGAGTFNITSAITPKTGDTFTGVYGAVLDASGWSTTDQTQGIFRANNQDIDNVTIRNLVIRNSPQRGIHAYKDFSDRWVIDHNEIYGNRIGIMHGNYFQIRDNYIHDNWQYGISSLDSTGSLIENNEFAWNAARWSSLSGDSASSKWVQVSNTTVRANFVHDNYLHGIWFDGSLTGNVIDNNVVTRNGSVGIFYEVSGQGVISDNRVESNVGHGIFVSTSQNVEVYGNRLILNGGMGIQLFLDGSRSAYDLKNNYIHDNFVDASDARLWSNHLAAAVSCINVVDGCVAASDSKNNRFVHNAYDVPSVDGGYFYFKGKQRTWAEWQADGNDTAGQVS
ncbi:MAG: right-handed parallel beta-helix repeat-containing protein, partial [Gemmatimonadota bacterium]|nr:right-handed parallel beta-helix repeat-containing protein [Gemmatimonadota bacterium]